MKGKFKNNLDECKDDGKDECKDLLHPATAGADVPFNNSEVGGVGELGSKAEPQDEKQVRHAEQCR